MKSLLTSLILGLSLTLTTALYAFNPKEGMYWGLIVGANYAQNAPFTYEVTVQGVDIERQGQLGHDIMASVGGQIGYRFCDNFRFEFEGIYNNSPYSYLRFQNVTIHSPDSSPGFRMSGATQSAVFTFNAFYDLFGDYSSKAVPYIGGGVGYAYITNQFKFYYNDVELGTNSQVQQFLQDNFGVTLDGRSRSGLAGQAIAGISYYLDDYAYFALDGRYMVSQRQPIIERRTRLTLNQTDAKYSLYTINLIFNSAFDCA